MAKEAHLVEEIKGTRFSFNNERLEEYKSRYPLDYRLSSYLNYGIVVAKIYNEEDSEGHNMVKYECCLISPLTNQSETITLDKQFVDDWFILAQD